MIVLLSEPINLSNELMKFQARHNGYGALASFSGYVRDENRTVTLLELQHYPKLTEKEIKKFETEARSRFELIDCLIIHRYGKMKPGEVVVFVAALSTHRKSAIQAVDFLMDYLKTSAPFWKKEILAETEKWIEPKSSDYDANNAWKT